MTAATTSPAPWPAPPLLTLRYGAAADHARVAALHDRCSDETRFRRFHAPLPRTPAGLIRQTLEPDNGWSVVAELQATDDLVGMASVGPVSTHDLEVGILVEDAHQGSGIGTLLLREVAFDAVTRGYRTLICLTQPDNDAVLATVRRSGLRSRTTRYDGLMNVVIELPSAPEEPAA